MIDSPQKRHHDSYFLSLLQDQEVDAFINEILTVRDTTREHVLDALDSCALIMQPSESRAMIKACVVRKV
ncbi:MAG TPA: hypothetical protein VIS74_08435 [Chthoniobacterales bacterium]